jgi:L,D-transpeptidase catalytic domain
MKSIKFFLVAFVLLLFLAVVYLFFPFDQAGVVSKVSIKEAGINKKNRELLARYGDQRVIFIDFSKPSFQKRLWVIEGDTVLFQTYVAHGVNSGLYYARKFSNEQGTLKSCYGEFITTFPPYRGKHGLSLRLKGLESTNNNAYKRDIVFHAADYATPEFIRRHGYLGRSHGCFATGPDANKLIIKLALQKWRVKVLVVR